MNMAPFAMMFHNRFLAAERICKTGAAVSRLVLLSAEFFVLHCESGHLQACCFSLFAFRLFLHLNTKALRLFGTFSARERSVFYFTPLLPDSQHIRTLFVIPHYVYLSTHCVSRTSTLPNFLVIHSVARVICAGHLKLQTYHTLFTCSNITAVCTYIASNHIIFGHFLHLATFDAALPSWPQHLLKYVGPGYHICIINCPPTHAWKIALNFIWPVANHLY